MQLSVNGRHIDIGDAFRSHIEDSLTNIFGKYFGDALDTSVVISRNGHLYHARVNAHVGRGMQLSAENSADRPYNAFDGAADRLSKRLRRYKRRLRDHHAEPVAKSDAVAARQYVLSGEEAEPEESEQQGGEPAVVAEMPHEIPNLTVSEAVMRLDLGELPALMFRNAAHGGFNVIYRRPDGNIGWIDPVGNAES